MQVVRYAQSVLILTQLAPLDVYLAQQGRIQNMKDRRNAYRVRQLRLIL